jgi:hypothetical protein
LNYFFQKRFRQQKANYGELNNFEKWCCSLLSADLVHMCVDVLK